MFGWRRRRAATRPAEASRVGGTGVAAEADAEAEAEAEADEDEPLRLDEIEAVGGSWGGLLFDNPSIGLAPELTWSFDVTCVDVSRPYGDTPVTFGVEWAPLPASEWWAMTGQAVACDAFAEPVEGSLYFFEHHRFDRVQVDVFEQRGTQIRARVALSGDVDGLGIDAIEVETWLTFSGITVALDDPPAAIEAARERLELVTRTTGLSGHASGGSFRFVP